MLLGTDNEGWTVFLMAVESSEMYVFQRILNLANYNLTKVELKQLLLATDNEGRTVFHVAARRYKLELFQRILNLAK